MVKEMVRPGKVSQTGTRTRWDTISFTVFVVVYVPCLATLAAIRKE
jgi:Fe2+ transport system protein B